MCDECLQWLHTFGLSCAHLRTGNERGDSLLQTVESLAEAHAGHRQLFDVAALLTDSERLYSHMAASPGMTTYVFDR